MENLSEDRIIKDRLEKLEKLRKLKIDPYPNRWEKDRTIIHDAITAYDDSNESANSKQLCISGRIIAKRAMGKIIFFDIKDQSGKIQLHYKEEESEINKDFWQFLLNIVQDVEEDVAASFCVLKTLLLPCRGKWLTRKSSNVEVNNGSFVVISLG